MIVVIANDLPPAVRGRMKLWFIEPRPNIFVSGIRDAVAEKVVAYLHKHCPPSSGLLIVRSTPQAPGMVLTTLGQPKKPIISLSGLSLILESVRPKL